MNSSNLLLFVALVLSISCISKNKIKDTREVPSTNIELKEKQVSKEQEIKSLYLKLSKQLERSDAEESQDLAKLSKAVSEASDDDLMLFLTSGYSETVAKNLSEEQEENIQDSTTPEILKDEKTRTAAITMVSLGAISIAGGLTVVQPGLRSGSAIGLGIASIIIGHKLLEDQSVKNKDKAENLTLSAGIISSVFALGSIASGVKIRSMANQFADVIVDDMPRRGNDLFADPEDFVFDNPRDVRNRNAVNINDQFLKAKASDKVKSLGNLEIGKGVGLAAIGAGLIYASQTAFDLADSNDTPSKTLEDINKLIANYKVSK